MAGDDAMADDGKQVTPGDATPGDEAMAGDGQQATAGDEAKAGIGEVELLYWSGCPSHPRALADLREAMEQEGLDAEAITVREVGSEEQAERERFVGSPTIRIDGRDIRPPEPDEPYGLTCRVYHRRDGRISPTPDPEDVREALRAALERRRTASLGGRTAPSTPRTGS